MTNRLTLHCSCHDSLHLIDFDANGWDEDGDIYVTLVTSANGFGFWRRLREAARYVFGRRDVVRGDIILDAETAYLLHSWLTFTSVAPTGKDTA